MKNILQGAVLAVAVVVVIMGAIMLNTDVAYASTINCVDCYPGQHVACTYIGSCGEWDPGCWDDFEEACFSVTTCDDWFGHCVRVK